MSVHTLSVGKRLGIIGGAGVLASTLVGAFASVQLDRISETEAFLALDAVPSMLIINEINDDANSLRERELNYVIVNDPQQLAQEEASAAELRKEIAAGMAEGDLTGTIEIRTQDGSSLLYAIKSMRDRLATIVTEVRSGTNTIATASSEIAAGNIDLSSRTEEQASSLEETAASMEELTSTVKQNAENAQQGNQLASVASDIAARGGEVVSQVVGTMDDIASSSREIVDIIAVIDGIAFQTNILALNAAVEAARAGEQGRGFAVVASEVRSLAQRSATAAKEIKALINDSVDKVGAGTALVAQAGGTMQEVVESVKRVTDIMSEISIASNEQHQGIEQVNEAITQMDHVTQQNAALVEEAAAAADSLQQQAARLLELVDIFKLDGHAMVSRATPRPTATRTGLPTALAALRQ